MEVKIGIQSIPRELIVETRSSAADLEQQLKEAIGADEGGLFTLSDDRGGKILVPASKIAYVEFTGTEQRRVGFGSL